MKAQLLKRLNSTSTRADPELVVVVGGWSCMLLLHPAPTCADAGPDLCTLHPDLCTLCSWCLSPAATYGSGGALSQLLAQILPLHVVVSPIATCTGVLFALSPAQIPYFRSESY